MNMKYFRKYGKFVGVFVMAIGFVSMRMIVGVEEPVRFNQEDLKYTPKEIHIDI